MNYIYEAKALLNGNMKRVEVRITDCDNPRTLGTASMGDCVVWIPASTVIDNRCRQVVFHELLHALFAIEHDDNCPLMSAICNDKLTVNKQNKLFLKHVK